MPKDDIHREYVSAWRTYLDSLEQALKKLETDINEASEMVGVCYRRVVSGHRARDRRVEQCALFHQ